MTLPSAENPVQPMLAKAVTGVPEPDSLAGGLRYEPKWDGFRGLVYFDGTTVEIGSRGSKMLTRYFPELVAAFAEQLPGPCVLDGEIIVRRPTSTSAERSSTAGGTTGSSADSNTDGSTDGGDDTGSGTGSPGGERLDWEALSQRIHPAASRVQLLSVETPAAFVAFDLLRFEDRDLTGLPFDDRRAALETLAESLADPLFLSQTTLDVDEARRWLEEFEGAGLDGVVAKPRTAPYAPGKRTMLKAKHHRTADVVAIGYRVHKSGSGVGSLLLGLFDGDEVRQVGGVSAFSDVRRQELVAELEPLVVRDADGRPVVGEGERSRFSSGRDTTFVPLRPERVLEVRYDQMEGDRFRHTVQFERWRPDRVATSCTFTQLEAPAEYDLGKVLR